MLHKEAKYYKAIAVPSMTGYRGDLKKKRFVFRRIYTKPQQFISALGKVCPCPVLQEKIADLYSI